MSEEQAYSYDLRITKDRIAVLIGSKGETKTELETQTSCKIQIDSKEGDITISGKDAIQLFALREVIKAISRGFNPEIAKQLLKQDYVLEIVPLTEYSREKSHQERMKGRVIGMEGKSRRTIEDLTETNMSVYGKTISILGSIENVAICKKAIEMLLDGSPHASVYKWLERQRRLMRTKDIASDGF